MKNTFIEYIGYDDQKKKVLWNNSTFVFDTNVLLNLYRYSKATRDSLLDSLRKLNNNIWLPHQVALEFFSDRCSVIYESIERYEEITNKKSEFIGELKRQLRMNQDNKEIIELDEKISKWIDDQKNNDLVVSKPDNDLILQQLLDLYDGKIGPSYDEEKLKSIREDGEIRYKKEIPPGYKDSKKDKVKENRIYGDLILWLQIIDYSKENQNNIVFVTDDKKEDWWAKSRGKTVGPRPELLREFINETKNDLLMYSMNSFLENMKEFNDQDISEDVMSEVKEMSISDNLSKSLEMFINEEKNISDKDSYYYDYINMDENIKFEMENSIKGVHNSSLIRRINQKINFIMENIDTIEGKIRLLNVEIDAFQNKINSYGIEAYEGNYNAKLNKLIDKMLNYESSLKSYYADLENMRNIRDYLLQSQNDS